MEGGATFVVELYPEYAPQTVDNFQKLVYAGFYNGLTFHRIVEGFMIQGGDPKGDGTGSSPIKIPGEFASNGFSQNTLTHERGVISMARGNNLNSASCQFFIVHETPSSGLDGKYAAFGRVVAGMETVDAIANVKVTAQPYSGETSKPVRVPVIANVCFVNYVAPVPTA
ncbi:MAG: peptidylprolyl isomerase [Ruminococcaceae bacterium]|nr:peptidylprolyl isomerase [Oscillospiraceae bacterium]